MTLTDFTEDRFLDGAVQVRQPATGYRAGLDAILLAAAVEAPAGGMVLEAGCGAGAALLAAAHMAPNARFLGLERDPAMAALARENAAANRLAARAAVREADIFTPPADLGVFDGAFCNPPYDVEGRAQEPHPARRAAYLSALPVDSWVKALADRLRGGSALTMIHRAEKLGEILAALEGRLGGAEIFPLRPASGAPAKRVLVRARKGSRAPLRLLAGLDLHDATGAKFTPEIDAILRGRARIAW